jgi:chromosome segregation ATPase
LFKGRLHCGEQETISLKEEKIRDFSRLAVTGGGFCLNQYQKTIQVLRDNEIGIWVRSNSDGEIIERSISVLYLAEVRKQKSGFMGKASTELKLLACQRNDQTWSAVPGDEVVPCEVASDFESGVMVMVNLSGNRQVQGAPELGGPRLVSILQSFSKLISDRKSQEEEIEAWNQSLTLQAQELNKREMELEAELTQLEQMREEAVGLEAKIQEAERIKAESNQLQAEFERKSQELEQAWEHLRGEQRKLEERQEDMPSAGGLTEEQSARIQELVGYLETTPVPTQDLPTYLNAALAAVQEQQDYCESQRQQLEQQRAEAEGQQAEAERQGEELRQRRQQLQEVEAAIAKARNDLHEQRLAYAVKQEAIQRLNQQIDAQTELYQSLSQLAAGAGTDSAEEIVDIGVLENMPLGELQQIVNTLQNDLNKAVQFVNDQEEELSLEREELEGLKTKLESAGDYDRINLEQELADAQDRYKMLNETLMGQRREVRKQESKLSIHLRILRRRQGIMDVESEMPQINLGPILERLEAEQKDRQNELQTLEQEGQGIQDGIQRVETLLEEQKQEQNRHQQDLSSIEEAWQELQTSTAQMWAKVNVAQENLQPLQEALADVRQKLEALVQTLDQAQQTGENQQQAIANLKETISSLS